MKKNFLFIITISLLLAGCAPNIHLDLLGKDEIHEVMLIRSPAKEKILILDVAGLISTTVDPGLFEREGDILSRVYYRLEKASEDKRIKALILRLDTPGGEVTASDILYNEIIRFKEKTGIPVVGLMMGLAASGGYYVASACDHIIAHPSTITGSIGVISIFPNLQELFAKIGIKVSVIKSGEMKDSGSAFRDLTEEEKKIFQDVIDEMYNKFLDVVYQKRKDSVSLEELKKIADGRIYTASQARELKLIDEIGYFDSALKKALSLAKIKEAKVIAYTYYPKRKTNIYATKLEKTSLLEGKSFEDMLRSLKSGFYYLWLPQVSR
ncbi:MAG: signal peptide peptidase SppA [Candidatus Aminicenantes bacterium]|nr:signal peptide peptidase SppA [Candidatus Aminicenantes bacterium]